jgi:hypothetical protein
MGERRAHTERRKRIRVKKRLVQVNRGLTRVNKRHTWHERGGGGMKEGPYE